MKRTIRLWLLIATVSVSSCVHPHVDPVPAPVVEDDKVDVLWVATVDDFAKRDQASTQVLNTLAAGISPHKFREYDVENPEWRSKWSKYVDAAGGPPCAFFLDFKTKNPVGKSIPLPKTWDDLKKEINSRTTRPLP